MKTATFKSVRWGREQMVRAPRAGGVFFALVAVLAAASVTAQPVLSTLTGGPSQANPPYWGYVNGDTAALAQFHTPVGLAMNATGDVLYVADRDNNVVRKLNLPANVTSTFATGSAGKINQPVAVAVDGAANVYVLNRGNGNNGTVLKFNAAGSLVATNATMLANATAMALDGVTNLFVTVSGNSIIRITPSKVVTPVATLTNAGVQLQGIAVLDDGALAVSDAGNHGIWLVDPFTGNWWPLAGFNGAGDNFGPGDEAQFNQPAGLSKAGDGYLVVADRGNHRVKIVDAWYGDVYKLYGVSSSLWYTGAGAYPGWWDGTVSALESEAVGSEEAREPVGVVVAPNGDVYATEVYYHLIRKVTGTGLAEPGSPGVVPQFNAPMGVALDSAGENLYVADSANNSVFRLSFTDNSTVALALANLDKPVAVALDGSDNLYVLNQATGANGSVLKFTPFGNFLGTSASGLNWPTALALDASGNVLVAELGGAIKRIPAAGGPATTLAVVTNAGVQLQGLVVQDYGSIAVSDAGNHAVYLVDPDTGVVTLLTGKNGPGSTVGTAPFVQFNQPHQLAKAGAGLLVLADYLNDRVMVVDQAGTATSLATSNSLIWFGRSGDPVSAASSRFMPMRRPSGIVVAPNGDVLTSELLNHNVRRVLSTGLTGPGNSGSGGGTATNIVVLPPTFAPNSGYFPMGQLIRVTSPNPNVFYTTDGSVPTTNSLRVTMNGNSGVIRWGSPTKDLTWLRLRAFVGTNASVVIDGQPVPTNSIGVPPGLNTQLYAGVGSTIVLPVVTNLRTNERVRSLQFRVEVTPDASHANNVSEQFRVLSIHTNDFVRVVTAAQGSTSAVYSASSYATAASGGRTNRGLAVSAIATNANVIFTNYAVVAMLAVPIPKTASPGQTYFVNVLNASATSDGLQTPVSLPSMPMATILVTNTPYTVGDSSPGNWYNAGDFGNGDLDNADVNNAFYASLGVRVPHSFSDAYNAMDTFPADGPGFVGGDGLIRYLDWQLVLQRSLRLNTNNWVRMWTANGVLTNTGPFALPQPQFSPRPEPAVSPDAWYRQALVGAVPVGHVGFGQVVDVPVYVKTVAGASLSGLQFRASVTPDGLAPALTSSPDFIPAEGVNPPGSLASLSDGVACGWPLGSVSFGPLSSNLLGYVRFAAPVSVHAGQTYTVSFAFADGAPNITTAYNFETRSAQVKIGVPAAPASISSEEWRARYFESASAPEAGDFADADHDGLSNWQEFIAGTDPTQSDSKLAFLPAEPVLNGGQKQLVLRWQTVPGRIYEILQSASPEGPTWTPRATFPGDGNEAEFVETANGGGAAFYRLRVQ